MKTFISKNWWSFIFNGTIAILYGLLALFIPAETLIVLVKYTGILILFVGVTFLLIAISRIVKKMPFAMIFTLAIVILAIGALVTFKTSGTIELVLILLGIWALLSGIFQMLAFLNFDKSLKNKELIIANILITIVFGIMLLFNPFAFAKFLVAISGALALCMGVLNIWFGFRMRNIK